MKDQRANCGVYINVVEVEDGDVKLVREVIKDAEQYIKDRLDGITVVTSSFVNFYPTDHDSEASHDAKGLPF